MDVKTWKPVMMGIPYLNSVFFLKEEQVTFMRQLEG